MILRRTFIQGLGGVLVTPALLQAGQKMPEQLPEWLTTTGGTQTCVADLQFSIRGWDGLAEADRNAAMIPLHLPSSWRSSYL